ncbi:MAG: hypothetical protein E6G11_00855 [Actinobacteria bacterium]|nr:MAG: hypothetical protein E6G11_00855 [Actinomycetota bacterium]
MNLLMQVIRGGRVEGHGNLVTEHARIVEAFAYADLAAARQAITEHIETGRRIALEAIERAGRVLQRPLRPYAHVVPEWIAEIVVDEPLARLLIREQLASLAVRSLRRLAAGCDNTVWLADDRWAFRFPRREIAVPLVESELAVLPYVESILPLAVPAPLDRLVAG